MPDYGQLDLATLPDRPAVAEGQEGWDLPEARVISLTFEVRKAQALPLLPSTLIRPVPAYAKLIVVDAPDSPAGPYREAGLFVGARDRVQIRNVLLDGIVVGAHQLEAARSWFGGSRRTGTVDLLFGEDEIRIAIADADGPLCNVRMAALRRCDATMLKFDALLVPGATRDGSAALLRYGVRVPLTEVEGTLSRDWSLRMPRTGTVWAELAPAYNVTAFMSHGAARIEPAKVERRE
jgi:hypothetical protein